jgi:hypothetical protein
MKNLLRYLARTFINSASENNNSNNNPQNNLSCIGYTTFFNQDGDLLQLAERYEHDCTYGSIQIQLRKTYIHLSDAERVLHHFMTGLQQLFQIVHTTEAGYRVCKTNGEHVTTVYWQDAETRDWKVQGWTNGETMRVRYIKNINAVPVQLEDQFFGGLSRMAV